MAENVSAPIAIKKIVENVRAMLSTPETPSLGRTDTPNEGSTMQLIKKKKARPGTMFSS